MDTISKPFEELNAKLKWEKAGLELSDSSYGKYLKENISMLKSLDKNFDNAPLEIKQMIISSMFPEKLIFENDQYRTKRVNEVIKLMLVSNNSLGTKKMGLTNFLVNPMKGG